MMSSATQSELGTFAQLPDILFRLFHEDGVRVYRQRASAS